MKKILMPALLGVALLAAPAAFAQKAVKVKAPKTAPVAVTTYKVQPQLSTLGWEGKAVGHGHNGTVQFTGGDVQVNGSQIVGGTVTVDMKTLKVTDGDAGSQAKLQGHLSNADFFDVPTYPTATFKITKVAPLTGDGANNVTGTGDMTIHGKTQVISFPAQAGVKNGVAAVTGKATVDRSKFDVKFRSKSFFSDLGDKAIYDDFVLDFNVIAKQ